MSAVPEMAQPPSHPRLEAWQQKLLDLSRRNPLLAIRLSRGLSVMAPDPLAAAQFLLGNSGTRPQSLPVSELGITAVLGHATPVVATPTIEMKGTEDLTSETATASKARRLRRTDLSASDLVDLDILAQARKVSLLFDAVDDEALQDDLADMARQSRARREEAGVNTLFLVVGFLRWRDSAQGAWSDAPLFLLPMDLARPNARTAFRLEVRDEEVVLNPAVAYLFEREHGVDWSTVRAMLARDGGADIEGAWRSAEESLAGLEKFAELTREGRLALLSYAKHRMWQDLRDRAPDILSHPVVERLLDPSSPRPEPMSMEDLAWEKLDDSHPPNSLLLPLPADASQLRAIVRVDRGENLVIQGPPGTGKSQTIANLIAHSLGRGRRVLFVAEKMTALSVVHNRLTDLGLGAFCLELHASKSDKAGVLRQLREALDARLLPTVAGFSEAATKIHAQRQALNQGLAALHEAYPNGLTVFQAIGRLAASQADLSQAGLPPAPPALAFASVLSEPPQAQQLREQSLRNLLVARKARPPSSDVFDLLKENPPSNAVDFFALLASWASSRQSMGRPSVSMSAVQDLQVRLKQSPENGSMGLQRWKSVLAVWTALAECASGDISPALRVAMLEPQHRIAWEDFQVSDAHYAQIWSDFQPIFKSSFLRSGHELRQEWELAQTAIAPLRWWRRRGLLSKLQLHQRQGQPPTPNQMDLLLSTWPEIEQSRKTAMAAGKVLREKLGNLSPAAGQWEPVRAAHAWAQRLEDALSILRDPVLEKCLRSQVVTEVSSPGILFPISTTPVALATLASAVNGLTDLMATLAPVFGSALRLKHPDHPHLILEDWSLDDVDDMVSSWRAAQPAWTSWEAAERLRRQAVECGLEALILEIESGYLAPEQSAAVLDRAYLEAFVNHVQMTHPERSAWQGHARAQEIRDFVLKDAAFEKLTRQHLAAKVAERVRAADLDRDPAMGILRRELAKQRQHLPPRTLLRQLASIVPILKPCMMMSPLSAADVLGSDTPPFDLVIFDEASQIPVADAVGALSHAKQVVVVGDPKQMPPNRGFAGMAEDDSEDAGDAVTPKDLESILDECLATMDHVVLNWHYRSRHEDLIAFSNSRYYKGELITFPSVETSAAGDGVPSPRGLMIHEVNGLYERGSSQTNPDEARAVVAAMAAHLRKPAPHETLGVITFNQRQQRLIEKLWDRELRLDPALEFAQNRLAQDLIVKNLENVQGDERDVIFFSTTFGTDAAGRFLLNFGPLGQFGGERRLNVAITRARDRLEIFSSFRPEQIDVSSVKHQGIVDLRDYLTFARGGATALAGVASPTLGLPDSPFEIAVSQSLEARGWIVHPQVGCSGYKIDMAIVDPSMPGRYLAGIECDGATYHSFKIARDRDRQRQRILEGLGWRIERIWSTDWFADPRTEIDRIDAALRALVATT
jgi:hypothetical protein